MFTVTYAQLNAWLTAFLWPFARIAALVAAAPAFGHTSVPARVKVGLAAFMTLIVAPTLGPMPDATVFSGNGVWIMANQLLIGAALGFTMQLVFAAVEMAGSLVGLQMGLGFATFFDPMSNASNVVISRYLNTIAMIAFLTLDGHLQVVSALVASFDAVPISASLLGPTGLRTLVQWGGAVFSAGLLLALPVVVALLIANLSLGILNRAAPQIGIFQIGFSITLLVGMLLLQLMLPNMIPFFSHLFDLGVDEMGRIAGGLR
ncbi:flagellar biosynthetic protein FliR [Trinickia caryophylli]|uniref:Flagellar biosynthetic protein FliR n=1 Tax=Trinickia caryophylli TaxID=28094 RepID=A0A1X7FGQ5_TRICW|nr:flagellar biosynthetic protein FliR [Trinickia caryophylli]PMS13264.1 flagellar biosynthetic protein FliR [Trinickia caryophylli]TRX19210.1 flagellar biosynthetic protein FliR [Trinickia caryophylli]WQE13490.1 flagellar biosynthetic protein FliR [Trinickia caryophylli]SMF51862.1 flagellar biosynthetic protein FliR [Trinickia caryophylli]GLU33981.1 flagellar biosynthetic protein FliR [Trinickia caryophylli]